jgi:hypothetical protein
MTLMFFRRVKALIQATRRAAATGVQLSYRRSARVIQSGSAEGTNAARAGYQPAGRNIVTQ